MLREGPAELLDLGLPVVERPADEARQFLLAGVIGMAGKEEAEGCLLLHQLFKSNISQ